MHPLGEFIVRETKRLGITDSELAKRAGVDKGTISNWISEAPPEMPSYKLLTGLARATGKDLCTIVALVDPDLTQVNPRVQIFASEIADLTPAELDILDNRLLALSLQRSKKSE